MKKTKNIKDIIVTHIINNKKEYIIVSLIFIIGIFVGVLYINNIQTEQSTKITDYLSGFVNKLKQNSNINNMEILQSSVMQSIILITALWFLGTTVIGLPIVFGVILYRGFCLGYTISAIITVMGIPKGMAFIVISLILQNIIFIPAVIAVAVSGFKLYKSILKNRRRENIKLEILRHTIFSLLMLMMILIASLIETFISTNLLKNLIKYF